MSDTLAVLADVFKPKKKKMSKRQQENLLRSYMIDKLGIAPILTAMGVDKEVYK